MKVSKGRDGLVASMAALLVTLLGAAPPAAGANLFNGVPGNQVGSWAVNELGGGEVVDNGLTGYIDFDGNIGVSFPLEEAEAYVDTPAMEGPQELQDLEGNDKGVARSKGFANSVTTRGSFPGQNGTIDFTVTTTLAPGSTTLVQCYTFTSEGALGTVRFMQYADGDIGESAGDDLFQPRGSAAAGNLDLLVFDPDLPQGLSLLGSFNEGQGLVNATFQGWAAGDAESLYGDLSSGDLSVSPTGVIDTGALPPFHDPMQGPAYGRGDAAMGMIYNLVSTASEATIFIWIRVYPDGVPGGCVPGDIHPDGTGDGFVDLRDACLGFRKVHYHRGINERDETCGDVWPGHLSCNGNWHDASWCIEGDGEFLLGDALKIVPLSLGLLQANCTEEERRGLSEAAPSGTARLAGDLAPTGSGDDHVDIADVVRALRLAVGIDAPSAEEAVRVDVAPLAADGVTVVGDDNASVGDVVGILRVAVGLSTLQWPERTLAVRIATSRDREAVGLSIHGWPAWAAPTGVASRSCFSLDGLLVLAEPGSIGWSCMEEVSVMSPDAEVVTFTYRGAEAVAPDSLVITAQVVDNSLALLPATVTVQEP